MRKKLLIVAGTLLGLILLVTVALVIYIRSGRLDLLLKSELISALDDAGIRAEIGNAKLDLAGYRVTLEDLHLIVKENGKDLGSVDRLIARFSVISYLHQRFRITHVQIVHPHFFLQIDQQGRLSLDPLLEQPSKKKEEPGPVTFSTAAASIEQGEADLVDLQHDLVAHLTNLAVSFTPEDPTSLRDELNHRAQLTFEGATAVYKGREIQGVKLELEGHIGETDAAIDKLELHSDLANVTLAGKLASFEPLKYETSQLRVEADTGQVGKVFAPEAGLNGRVLFDGKVAGTGTDYHASGNLESSALVAKGVHIAGLRLKTSVEGSGPQYNAITELASGAISGNGLKVNSLSLSGGRLKGREGDFDFKSGLKTGALTSGAVTVSDLRSNLEVDNKRLTLSGLSAAVLGGGVSGSATIALSSGSSKVDVDFRQIELAQVATLAAAKQVKVNGTTSGSATLEFPKLDYKSATGRISASIDGSVAPGDGDSEGTKTTGDLVAVATGKGFKIEHVTINSASSTLQVSGEIDWNGKGAFDVDLKSTDLAAVQNAVDSFGLIPQDVKDDYEPAITGEGTFKGRAEVDLDRDDVQVNGHLSIESIKLHDEEAGELSGDVAYNSTRLTVTNGSLVRSDGSRADFDLSAGLENKDDVAIKGHIKQFSLPALVATAAPRLSDLVPRGFISGDVDLKGLPGPRTIEGTAKVSLSDAEFNLPTAEEENGKVEVPEFTGDLSFANSILTIKDVRLRTGGTDLSGRGTFNLDTYEYSVDAGGTQLDLAVVSRALPENVKMTGTADVKIVGQGKWGSSDDWSGLHLNGSIQGKSVAINGRDLGDASITAMTENGLLKIEASGRVAEQMRSLGATIDLRDRANYPVNASIEFTDQDIAPYLSWVAPELSDISGRATGTIKVSGPLQRPDEVQVVATFQKLEIGGAISEGRKYTITNQGDFVIRGSSKGVTLDHAVFTGEGTSVTLEGGLDREGNGRSTLSINGEVNLRLLSSFTPIIYTTGAGQLQASITGSLQSPQLSGLMDLKDVGVRIVDFPISAAHGNGVIRFTANQALVERFTATTPGGGSITIGGGAALAGLVPDRWRLEVTADQVSGEYPRDTQTVVDANLTLQGNRRLQVLSGNLEVRRASYTKDVTLDELITGGGPFSSEFLEAGPGGSGAPSGLKTTLDLHVVADNTLIIKNNLADAVGSAYLSLRGSLDDPAISGRVLLNRGTVEFRNGRWDLTRGLVTLPGRRGADPIIDVQTESDIRGYHITALFSGEVSKLQVQVRSDPDIPEPDIISLVLTGSISSDRSTTASVAQNGLGLAQSILSASLSEQLQKGTQRLFGLSRFSIDPLLVGRGNDPTARITVGQRITKDLTVTYSQNLSSGSSGLEQVVLVEYRLTNRFSVVGYRNERGELGFDVRLRKRF